MDGDGEKLSAMRLNGPSAALGIGLGALGALVVSLVHSYLLLERIDPRLIELGTIGCSGFAAGLFGFFARSPTVTIVYGASLGLAWLLPYVALPQNFMMGYVSLWVLQVSIVLSLCLPPAVGVCVHGLLSLLAWFMQRLIRAR